MKILVINGPNINFTGIREKGIYGCESYDEICKELISYANGKNTVLEIWQSNHEGEIIDKIQSTYNSDTDAVIINPGAYTHYSYAIADAIKSIDVPFIEVHMSDIKKREDFRRISVTKDVCKAQICALGKNSYVKAIDMIINGEVK